jgi:hypothetical protein
MLYLSAAVLFGLTWYAWRTAQQLKAEGDPKRLRYAYLAAAVCGAIGGVCTLIAAII